MDLSRKQFVRLLVGSAVSGLPSPLLDAAQRWIAHHLATLGCKEFVLFGGASIPQSLRSVGPLGEGENDATTSSALAGHLRRLNQNLKVTALGNFDLRTDLAKLRGLAVGAMSVGPLCTGCSAGCRTAGHNFLTLGLPTKPTAKVWFGLNDVAGLNDGHFGGPPIVSRYQALEAAAQAVGLLV